MDEGIKSYIAGERITLNDKVRCPRGRRVYKMTTASKVTPCNECIGIATNTAAIGMLVYVKPLEEE